FEVLHRDVVRALGVAAVVDRDDVRVGEPGGVLRLAAEALDELVVGRVPVVEDLDRDPAPELLVLGEIDVGHAAGAELADDLVTAVEDRVDQGVRYGHRFRRLVIRPPGQYRLHDGLRDRLRRGAAGAPLVLEDDRDGDGRVVGRGEGDEPGRVRGPGPAGP